MLWNRLVSAILRRQQQKSAVFYRVILDFNGELFMGHISSSAVNNVLMDSHQHKSVSTQYTCQSLHELNLKMQNLDFQYIGKISL